LADAGTGVAKRSLHMQGRAIDITLPGVGTLALRDAALALARGGVGINATFNNTRVCIADQHGNVVAWGSGGRAGFKGSRKSTSYVAQQIGMDVAKRAMSFGMREVEVRMKGPGAGRESAVRGIAAAGLNISVLRDVTPIPHNGCRPPKRRRV
ncbi:MAG: 30S ribosomal protein S11, partial [Lentisphaerae bacterium]|nr:30S ribosomal protein S11 [Lentisphaerota bacterium]